MNTKTAVIAFAVRLLSEKSSLIAKPDPMSEFINRFCGIESYDVRVARAIEDDLQKVTSAAKRVSTNHKFKKLTKNF
jgi:hypothetical protein